MHGRSKHLIPVGSNRPSGTKASHLRPSKTFAQPLFMTPDAMWQCTAVTYIATSLSRLAKEVEAFE
jgi:hypothetical protein